MSGVKKPKHMEPAVVAHAAAVVEASPRGAPETLEAPAPFADLPAPVFERPCVLDDLPVGSKLVVVRQGDKRVPIAATPGGFVDVPETDVSRGLPEGAKIVRLGTALFAAEQLDSSDERPKLVLPTGRAAVDAFYRHFHG